MSESKCESDSRHQVSVPAEAGARWKALEQVLARNEPKLTAGSRVLRRPEVAALIQNALLFFEAQRYYLSSWCVMPNHVHVVVTPAGPFSLSSILHSWKSFTAKAVNELLGRHGSLWERESFDHLIRSVNEWQSCIEYTERNPVAAGLCDLPERWPYSSRGTGFHASPEVACADPRKTPFAFIRSRGELPHLYKESGTYFVTFRQADAVVLQGER